MVAQAADLPHLRRLAPRGRGDAQDGLEAVPDLRDPQLRDGNSLPQVRILDARSAPTERWSGRRWRSGAKSPGPRADVPARTDQRARADRPEARHQEADRRQRRREFGRPERRREFVVRRSLSRPSPTPFRFLPSRPKPSTIAWRQYGGWRNGDDLTASRGASRSFLIPSCGASAAD